ncbi:MAG TPA: hypothetical protein VIV11_01020 [Kofleriaceae bacterium]
MSTQPSSKKPVGKPTTQSQRDPRTRRDYDESREEPTKPDRPVGHDDRGTPSIEPGKQDANVSEQGTLTDDNEVE